MARLNGECRLCGNIRELAQSHIIPEFCHKPGYDEKHRLIVVRVDSAGKEYVQKGHRERLLCDKCEGHINRFEKYFYDCWYRDKLIPDQIPTQGVTITGLDYALFKLFHLSVLWRADVSADEQCAMVNLGPYSEKLRAQLMGNDPGAEDQFRISALALTDNNGSVLHDRIMYPIQCRLDGHRVYVSGFAGCQWVYTVSKHSPKLQAGRCFSRSGDLTLARQNFKDNRFVREFVRVRKAKLRGR